MNLLGGNRIVAIGIEQHFKITQSSLLEVQTFVTKLNKTHNRSRN